MNGQKHAGYDDRIGKRVRDLTSDRVGIVTDVSGETAYLRPEHGGREWTVPVDRVAVEEPPSE